MLSVDKYVLERKILTNFAKKCGWLGGSHLGHWILGHWILGDWILGERIRATAFKFEAAAARAGGVAADSDGRLRVSDLAEDDFRVDFIELHLFERSFAMGRALGFDEFDDFHGGLESGGG